MATPTFNIPPGTYSSAQSITLDCATPGATIFYSLNGSGTWTPYSTAISVSVTTTLNAIATKADMTDSDVAGGTYTISTSPPTSGAA